VRPLAREKEIFMQNFLEVIVGLSIFEFVKFLPDFNPPCLYQHFLEKIHEKGIEWFKPSLKFYVLH